MAGFSIARRVALSRIAPAGPFQKGFVFVSDFIPFEAESPNPVVVPPEKVKRRPSRFLGVISVLMLIAAFAGVFALQRQHAKQPPSTSNAAAILAKAADAPLNDASFTMTAKFGGTMGATTTAFTMKGTGTTTRVPFRMDVNLQIDLGIGSATNIEEIVDNSGLYMKMPTFTGTQSASKPWFKLALGGASGLGIDGNNYLDFHKLTNGKLIGEEIINGQKTWHLRAAFNNTNAPFSPSEAATATAVAGKAGIANFAVTEDVWIIEANSFPAQLTIHEGVNTVAKQANSAAPADVAVDETMTFTAWNSGITIALPPPSQVSEGFPGLSPTVTPKP